MSKATERATEHERYHQVTIETLQSIESYLNTMVVYSNFLLTLVACATVWLGYLIWKAKR